MHLGLLGTFESNVASAKAVIREWKSITITLHHTLRQVHVG